jgi:ATP/maltotriose-dependent transcriptional regulator MalT/DNA-binding SARP family transcriptional activator
VDKPRTRAPSVAALPRPRVQALLAAAWERRITVVIAGGGYGKTTALRALAQSGPVCWLGLRSADREIELLAARVADALGVGVLPGLATPAAAIGAEDRRGLADGQAAVLCEALEHRDEPLMLVFDDIEQLGDESSAGHLVRALCLQAPPQLHVALSGRRLPALGLGTASGPGKLLEIAAPDLAFTLAETNALLLARIGVDDDRLARECLSLTGGWAAALQLIVDRLERVEPEQWHSTLERLSLLGGALWREFVADLLDGESPQARRTLAVASVTPAIDPELLAGLGIVQPALELGSLRSRGLLVAAGDRDRATMSPVLSEVVAELLPAAEIDGLREEAGSWLERAGRGEEALECRLGGPSAHTRALLARDGHRLVGRGYGARVAEILTAIGTGDDPGLDSILGEALQSVGDWDGAMEMFRRVQRTAGGGLLAPEIAWRFGALLYLRGESGAALEVLSGAYVDGDGRSDDALVSAWLSSTQWSRGDSEQAAITASTAVRQADASGDPAARAAAHVAAALAAASAGDRAQNERHYRAALAAAGQAGDSIQLARIYANLSSRALEEGDYARAIEEADRGLSLAAGHKFFAALAMCNKADALLAVGELDEARAALVEAVETYSTLGSLLESAPHTLLGTLYYERGDLARARVSFERGMRLAEEAADAHTLVFASSGLALTLADDDPHAARDYASRAVRDASSLERAHALCASARVELAAGDRDRAARFADEAEREARRTGDHPALAEALALGAISQQPPREQQLQAAIALWDELGNTIAQQRTRLMLATVQGDHAGGEALRQQLAARGVVPDAGLPPLGAPAGVRAPELTIVTLGRFAVALGGERVPASAWQSRKARDLLKLLVGRRGRPITREAAAESLWPGEAPGPLANRLSVALSTLRKVLDPDRSHPADYFIAADSQSLALALDHVTVDVVEFLELATDGLSIAAEGDRDAARAKLRGAEKLYTGDFLEEDLYEDWAVDCREAARSAALEISRLLARSAAESGDDEAASRHLRRLLERDPYDEDAWIALVGAQSRLRRYGEARRQHAIYARRMAELDVAPVGLAETRDVRP